MAISDIRPQGITLTGIQSPNVQARPMAGPLDVSSFFQAQNATFNTINTLQNQITRQDTNFRFNQELKLKVMENLQNRFSQRYANSVQSRGANFQNYGLDLGTERGRRKAAQYAEEDAMLQSQLMSLLGATDNRGNIDISRIEKQANDMLAQARIKRIKDAEYYQMAQLTAEKDRFMDTVRTLESKGANIEWNAVEQGLTTYDNVMADTDGTIPLTAINIPSVSDVVYDDKQAKLSSDDIMKAAIDETEIMSIITGADLGLDVDAVFSKKQKVSAEREKAFEVAVNAVNQDKNLVKSIRASGGTVEDHVNAQLDLLFNSVAKEQLVTELKEVTTVNQAITGKQRDAAKVDLAEKQHQDRLELERLKQAGDDDKVTVDGDTKTLTRFPGDTAGERAFRRTEDEIKKKGFDDFSVSTAVIEQMRDLRGDGIPVTIEDDGRIVARFSEALDRDDVKADKTLATLKKPPKPRSTPGSASSKPGVPGSLPFNAQGVDATLISSNETSYVEESSLDKKNGIFAVGDGGTSYGRYQMNKDTFNNFRDTIAPGLTKDQKSALDASNPKNEARILEFIKTRKEAFGEDQYRRFEDEFIYENQWKPEIDLVISKLGGRAISSQLKTFIADTGNQHGKPQIIFDNAIKRIKNDPTLDLADDVDVLSTFIEERIKILDGQSENVRITIPRTRKTGQKLIKDIAKRGLHFETDNTVFPAVESGRITNPIFEAITGGTPIIPQPTKEQIIDDKINAKMKNFTLQ